MQTIEAMLAHALKIQATEPDQAAVSFAEVLRKDPANLSAHNALEHMRAKQSYGSWMHINCVIDPRDDIFRFFAGHALAKNPIREYLSDGWRSLYQLMLLLEKVDASLMKQDNVLEFAAGFGRFTRHLSKILPGRLTCADVLPGSVDFLKEQFEVEAFESSHTPENIVFPAQYDLVFVLSLFTHLPTPMWAPWLRRLRSAVKPGGLLVFTVHNEAVARGLGVNFNAADDYFIASSESPALDGQRYGTTYTTQQFAINAVIQEFGVGPLLYEKLAFWHGQDAVVIRT